MSFAPLSEKEQRMLRSMASCTQNPRELLKAADRIVVQHPALAREMAGDYVSSYGEPLLCAIEICTKAGVPADIIAEKAWQSRSALPSFERVASSYRMLQCSTNILERAPAVYDAVIDQLPEQLPPWALTDALRSVQEDRRYRQPIDWYDRAQTTYGEEPRAQKVLATKASRALASMLDEMLVPLFRLPGEIEMRIGEKRYITSGYGNAGKKIAEWEADLATMQSIAQTLCGIG